MQTLHPHRIRRAGGTDDEPPVDDPLDDTPTPTDLGELVDRHWADDEPLGEQLLESPAPIVALDLPVIDDEGGAELDVVVTQEAPLPPPAADPVVISFRSEAYVDGDPVAAVADPSRETTCWQHPGATGRRAVRLRVAGVVMEAVVEQRDGPPELRLGRDLLRGRFWIEV